MLKKIGVDQLVEGMYIHERFCRISIPSMADQVSYGARTLDESPCSTSKGCAFRSM